MTRAEWERGVRYTRDGVRVEPPRFVTKRPSPERQRITEEFLEMLRPASILYQAPGMPHPVVLEFNVTVRPKRP